MKHLFLSGRENASKADDIYWFLLNNYPRDTWDFSMQHIVKECPVYKFTLRDKAEKIFDEYEFA